MKNLIILKLKTVDVRSLNLYKTFLNKILLRLSLKFKIVPLPTKKVLLTLNKSPHVNKTAREQFMLHQFKSVVYISTSLNLNIIKYIIINKPNNMVVKIKKLR